MPIISKSHEQHAGKVIGNGHCVAFIRLAAGAPNTSQWRRGEPVHSALSPGTLIATFDNNGRYANATDGSSHAAIVTAVHDDGSLTVWDQWQGQPVHQRVIRNRGGQGSAVNDASRYYVLEVEEA